MPGPHPHPAALFICPALQAPGEPLGLPQPGLGRVWLWGGGCLGGLRRSPTQRRGVREHSGSGPLFPSCHPFVFPRGILRPRKELLPPHPVTQRLVVGGSMPSALPTTSPSCVRGGPQVPIGSSLLLGTHIWDRHPALTGCEPPCEDASLPGSRADNGWGQAHLVLARLGHLPLRSSPERASGTKAPSARTWWLASSLSTDFPVEDTELAVVYGGACLAGKFHK